MIFLIFSRVVVVDICANPSTSPRVCVTVSNSPNSSQAMQTRKTFSIAQLLNDQNVGYSSYSMFSPLVIFLFSGLLFVSSFVYQMAALSQTALQLMQP